MIAFNYDVADSFKNPYRWILICNGLLFAFIPFFGLTAIPWLIATWVNNLVVLITLFTNELPMAMFGWMPAPATEM